MFLILFIFILFFVSKTLRASNFFQQDLSETRNAHPVHIDHVSVICCFFLVEYVNNATLILNFRFDLPQLSTKIRLHYLHIRRGRSNKLQIHDLYVQDVRFRSSDKSCWKKFDARKVFETKNKNKKN